MPARVSRPFLHLFEHRPQLPEYGWPLPPSSTRAGSTSHPPSTRRPAPAMCRSTACGDAGHGGGGRSAGCPKGNLQGCVRGRGGRRTPAAHARDVLRDVLREVLQAAGRVPQDRLSGPCPLISARPTTRTLPAGRTAGRTSPVSPARHAGRPAPVPRDVPRPPLRPPLDEPLRADTPLQVPLRGTCGTSRATAPAGRPAASPGRR